jgi:hypothetical protein
VRTREDHALAVGARGQERNCCFFPCFLGQKAWRGVSKSEYHLNKAIGGTKHGREFVNAPDAGATELFCGYFKAVITVAFPRPQKN